LPKVLTKQCQYFYQNNAEICFGHRQQKGKPLCFQPWWTNIRLKKQTFFSPSLPLAEERVDQRSAVGVSRSAPVPAGMSCGVNSPDHRCARSALSPAGGKEGWGERNCKVKKNVFSLFTACGREGRPAQRRRGE